MRQYLLLAQSIFDEGTAKPAARKNMPGSISLFGPQISFDLADGFPLMTTKKVSFKNIVIELIWFLRGDSNIKYMVDNGVNIWNQDAYQYYLKQDKISQDAARVLTLPEFVEAVKLSDNHDSSWFGDIGNYIIGDTGYQYPKVWRNWQEGEETNFASTDQIRNVIASLRYQPESRRHIVTAVDPAHDTDLALYWCHSMFQLNARPLTLNERISYLMGTPHEVLGEITEQKHKILDEQGIPKYYLDCKMYQRSADIFLGVAYNIASYALLTHIIAKLTGMIPGKYIHTFGDAHIYDNHVEQMEEQISRNPYPLPQLYWNTEKAFENGDIDFDYFIATFEFDDIGLTNYQHHPAIKGDLSTGL